MSERLGAHYNRYDQTPVTEFNERQFQQNNFMEVYNKANNEQLSTQYEANIEYKETEYYITISSRDRDIASHPETNKYVVNFPTDLKNISAIELIQAIIPDTNDVAKEPYLLLKIDELEDVMMSVDRNVSDAFAILQPAPPVVPGAFIQIDRRIHEHTIKYFRIPKASLSKMTVTITDCAGVPFDFGSDNVMPPAKALQNTFVFKVVCMEKTRTSLGHRNVF
jgi:hypothetical protein